MRAVGIVRVSSVGQKDRYGPATQRSEIEARAAKLGVSSLDVWDYQESATQSGKRPQFDAMLERLVEMGQAGEIRRVILGRPDRLGRDGEQAFFYYFHLLEKTGGLEVRFARDDVDPDDPFRNFKLFLYAFKAKQDADTIRENTMRGRRQRATVGMIPNGNVPWPYDYDSREAVGNQGTGLPRINTERAEWVRKWIDWLLVEKTSLRTLGRRMEDAGVLSPRGSTKWSASTITRILSNKGLLGEFYAYRSGDKPVLVHSDEKLAILSAEDFQAVQDILSENRSLSIRNTKRDYTPLHGFVWCHCGRKAAVSPHRGVGYFRCNVCLDRTVQAELLWGDAKVQLSNILTRPEQVLPALVERVSSKANKEGLAERRLAIQAELKDLDSALERTIRMFAILDGFGEDKIRDEADRIKRRQQTLEADLEQVERSLAADGAAPS